MRENQLHLRWHSSSCIILCIVLYLYCLISSVQFLSLTWNMRASILNCWDKVIAKLIVSGCGHHILFYTCFINISLWFFPTLRSLIWYHTNSQKRWLDDSSYQKCHLGCHLMLCPLLIILSGAWDSIFHN